MATLGQVDGRGIGVAIIDSGIANHPALKGRVVANVDFTDQRGTGQDLYGHGTHIAGIIAARSFNNAAEGADSGMAPAAHLINLKVLGADGSGQASDVIAAIDFAIKYRKEFAIRVINLSLGAAPTQSYRDDPICQAVERAVRAGLVVVASAGNYGEFEGKQVYGSVTSPGISPYAITVGALRTQGTVDPSDDEIAPWSSKGPTMVDHIVKPDLVAPGSKIVSTAAAGGDVDGAVSGSADRRPRRARLLLDERHEHGRGGGERGGGVVVGWRVEPDAVASEAVAPGERGLHARGGLAGVWSGKRQPRESRRSEAEHGDHCFGADDLDCRRCWCHKSINHLG